MKPRTGASCCWPRGTACGLKLDQVDIGSRVLHIHRLKNGLSTDHPLLRGDELRTISGWLKVLNQMKVPPGVTVGNPGQDERDSGMKANTDSAMKPNSFRPTSESRSASPG
jgi:hypothetical protein